MKEHRVEPSKAPMTSIKVNGVPFHYFHSDKLGSCRAILIAPDENLAFSPAPTAEKSEKSHVDMVNEEIDLYEQETAKKAEKPQKNKLSRQLQFHYLMNCAFRIEKRISRYFQNYLYALDRKTKDFWWNKYQNAALAKKRIDRKKQEFFGAD